MAKAKSNSTTSDRPRTKATRSSSKSKPGKKAPQEYRLTHPERVLYPDLGITKRDLAAFYAQIAEWILPHLAGRPLSLVRCPDGVGETCFFQKHPPIGLSDAVERIKIQDETGVNEYLVVNDLEGIVAVVQFGALELHIWPTLADNIDRPDMIVFDLDPDPAVEWQKVIDTALLVRNLLKELKLESFVKTTGGKGLHVVVPLARKHTWEDVREFARRFADTIANAAPHLYLTNMSKAARKGKIFIDYLRNQRGATAVAAYSTRARAGATVSMPISWDKLRTLKSAAEFTVQTVPKILAGKWPDPWAEMPKTKQSLVGPRKTLEKILRTR